MDKNLKFTSEAADELKSPEGFYAAWVEDGPEPDWAGKCEVCANSPILPATGMCGPCTFGDANTAGGNW